MGAALQIRPAWVCIFFNEQIEEWTMSGLYAQEIYFRFVGIQLL